MEMEENRLVPLFQAIAKCMGMDEADVIDNNDGETVTIFNDVYHIIEFEEPVRHGEEVYYWAMYPVFI